MIENTDALKPDDWNEDKDGIWEPPKIKNPKYKGQWTPKQIKNPNYKGAWSPKTLPNPDYKEEQLDDFVIGGMGIDVWQVKPGTIYGNFIIADNISDVLTHAEKVLKNIQLKEKENQERENQKKEPEKEETKQNKPDL